MCECDLWLRVLCRALSEFSACESKEDEDEDVEWMTVGLVALIIVLKKEGKRRKVIWPLASDESDTEMDSALKS